MIGLGWLVYVRTVYRDSTNNESHSLSTLGKDAFDFPVFKPPFKCFGADSQSGSSDSWRYIIYCHRQPKFVIRPTIPHDVQICLVCHGKLRSIFISSLLPITHSGKRENLFPNYLLPITVLFLASSKYIKRALISAGLTPPILAACPMVRGLTLLSFSRDSLDKVSMVE